MKECIYHVTSGGSIYKGSKVRNYWSTYHDIGAGIKVEYFGKFELFASIYSKYPLTNPQINKLCEFFTKKVLGCTE